MKRTAIFILSAIVLLAGCASPPVTVSTEQNSLKSIPNDLLASEYQQRMKGEYDNFFKNLEEYYLRVEKAAAQRLPPPPLSADETHLFDSYLKFLKPYAAASDTNAQARFAMTAHTRLRLVGGVPDNRCEILDYALTAASEGSHIAAATLGPIYSDGILIASSFRLAYLWRKEAHRRDSSISSKPACTLLPATCIEWEKEWVDWSPKETALSALRALKKDECL